MVAVDHPRLLLTIDYLYPDACLLIHGTDNRLSVLGIPHSRCSTCPVVIHSIDLHKLLVAFHQTDHILLLFRRDPAIGEHIESEAQRHPEQQSLAEQRSCIAFKLLYKQSYRIGAYVDSGVCLGILLYLVYLCHGIIMLDFSVSDPSLRSG